MTLNDDLLFVCSEFLPRRSTSGLCLSATDENLAGTSMPFTDTTSELYQTRLDATSCAHEEGNTAPQLSAVQIKMSSTGGDYTYTVNRQHMLKPVCECDRGALYHSHYGFPEPDCIGEEEPTYLPTPANMCKMHLFENTRLNKNSNMPDFLEQDR